jgi:hypothetical protein
MTQPPPPPPPPALGQQSGIGQPGPVRRPPAVIAAVVLMLPVFVTWVIAGFGFLSAVARTEDGTGKFLLWILAVAILALCLLVALMAAVGMVHAWRGRSTMMKIPAGFTLALFCLALINLLVHRRISFHPTQVTPLVVGAMAGAAIVLINSKGATAWFAALGRR